jgi:hypothetical protein
VKPLNGPVGFAQNPFFFLSCVLCGARCGLGAPHIHTLHQGPAGRRQENSQPRLPHVKLTNTMTPSYIVLTLGPVLEPKYQKNLEAFFLEAFLVAKPGRVTVRLLPNRMIRERCIAPITLRCN